KSLLDDIEQLRRAPLPAANAAATPRPAALPSRPPSAGEKRGPSNCTPGDERVIRDIGPAFSTHWADGDAQKFAALWSEEGDVVHPDAKIERTRPVILANRIELFNRKEYRGSKHILTIGNIRCLSADIAVVDGRWEMRGLVDAGGAAQPSVEGLSTL